MAVAPMNAHFIWWDGSSIQETHIGNILDNISQIPAGVATGFLILVLRYINPDTGLEYDNPKLGHYIQGFDNYYVNLIGNPVECVEFASWNDPTTGQTRAIVYEFRGQELEVKRHDVRVNTLASSRKHRGVLIADNLYQQAIAIMLQL